MQCSPASLHIFLRREPRRSWAAAGSRPGHVSCGKSEGDERQQLETRMGELVKQAFERLWKVAKESRLQSWILGSSADCKGKRLRECRVRQDRVGPGADDPSDFPARPQDRTVNRAGRFCVSCEKTIKLEERIEQRGVR
eukprot:225449-Hanusia_phi.AAC.1